MRSQLIFEAQGKIANRYKLCHAVAKVTRCLHDYSWNTQEAISDALIRVAHEQCIAEELEHEQQQVPEEGVADTEAHLFFAHSRLSAWPNALQAETPGADRVRH